MIAADSIADPIAPPAKQRRPRTARAAFDIVLFGASGFTGRLTADYLAEHGGESLRWALAGRNPYKLQALRDRLTRRYALASPPQIIEADAGDLAAVRRLAGSARVVISAVGPYIRYGEPLVAACAEAGTDYADLSSESEFVDRMWLRYHDRARSSGARIVHCCGFDSVPHDLGALFTVHQLPQDVPIRLEAFVRVGGKLSGGTLSSMATAFGRWRESGAVRRERRRIEGRPVDRKIALSLRPPHYDRARASWVLPMPTIDSEIVLRSAAADERYGTEFHYSHYLQVRSLPRLARVYCGIGTLALAAQVPLLRRRIVALGGRGVGPSEHEREQGWFCIDFFGSGGGHSVCTEVRGGDPGYGESSKMLAESALCLAFDRLPRRGGVQTPAHAMGEALIRRLQSAGIAFRVVKAT